VTDQHEVGHRFLHQFLAFPAAINTPDVRRLSEPVENGNQRRKKHAQNWSLELSEYRRMNTDSAETVNDAGLR
jgi:hypothetical protein